MKFGTIFEKFKFEVPKLRNIYSIVMAPDNIDGQTRRQWMHEIRQIYKTVKLKIHQIAVWDGATRHRTQRSRYKWAAPRS